MSKLVILQGLPASGKTTWARKWVAEDPTARARVNRDDIRAMLHDGEWQGNLTERQVRMIRDDSIRVLLRAGINVVCDDTNLGFGVVKRLKEVATQSRAVWEVNNSFMKVPLDLCIVRDLNRDKSVGIDVITGMYEKFVDKEGQ